MNKILTLQQAATISKNIKEQKKTIVVAGGCFDILHMGHIQFLQKAKAQADILMVLLESDESIKERKGQERPINNQADRATLLSNLEMVDYVILLPQLDNTGYDGIIANIGPQVIATTYGDPHRSHKERQAELIGATVVDVIRPVDKESTSSIAQHLKNEL